MGLIAEMSEKPEQWYVVTDRVMGGSSNLEADFDDGTFKMTGNVVKKDGGFVWTIYRAHYDLNLSTCITKLKLLNEDSVIE